jgi:carboxylesterase
MSDSDVQVMEGAEAFSAAGGPNGVLVCHGFTGNPQSMRPLAEAFAAAGFTVELPRWPGHGTRVEDMVPTRWSDWSGAAEAAYQDLAARCAKVVVAGLSMGGTLTAWLAARHPEIAGIVLVNPAVEPSPGFRDIGRQMLDQGTTLMDAIGSDVADPDSTESAYPQTPVEPLLSLLDAVDELQSQLADIRCPALVFVSRNDHVVPPTSGEHFAAHSGGPVELAYLERSYHVATIDYDRPEIEARAVEFARKVTAG